MKRFNKPQPTVRSFQQRLSVAMIFVLICFAILLARFVWLQVITYNRHSVAAENNRIALIPIPANRGLITDRNGVVIARNYSAYTLEIIPAQIEMDVNTLLDELSEVVDIQAKDRRNFLKLFKESKTLILLRLEPYSLMQKWRSLQPNATDFLASIFKLDYLDSTHMVSLAHT